MAAHKYAGVGMAKKRNGGARQSGGMEDYLIDIKGVAALIGGSTSTARRMVKMGRLPPALDLGSPNFKRWSDRAVRKALGLLDDEEGS